MTNLDLNLGPAHPSFDPNLFPPAVPVDAYDRPGVLALIQPGTLLGSGVPSGTVENQSLYAVDLLGENARTLNVTNGIVTGQVEMTSKKALHVAHKRAAGSSTETFTFGNQRIRDYVAQNYQHKYGLAVSLGVTRAASSAWTVAASHRMLGFVDGTTDRMTIRANPSRTVVSGYPTTNPPRLASQTADATTGRGVAAAVFQDTVSRTISASTTIMSFHNGGAGSPALCFKLFFGMIVDLTVSGQTEAEFLASVQAKHDEQQAFGGLYFGDVNTIDPATL